MAAIFLSILKMSYTACFVIIAVCIMRLVIRRAPKKYAYLLWSVVGFRLCVPISWHSVFSIFGFLFPVMVNSGEDGMIVSGNAAGSITQDISFQIANTSGLNEGMPLIVVIDHAGLIPTLVKIGTVLWMAGVLIMLFYGILTHIKMRRQLETAIRLKDNIYQSEKIRSPFVFGMIYPRIYVPYGLDEQTLQCVLAHERYHIRRKDYIIKSAAFLLLTLHWFNPLCWLAFYLMDRDMEMSCDEKVLAEGKTGIVTSYSTALLGFASVSRSNLSGPLAFGETGVKRRVKNILTWKKTKAGVTVAVACLCIVTIFVCAANPAEEDTNAYAKTAMNGMEENDSELYAAVQEKLAYTGFNDAQIEMIYNDLKEDNLGREWFFSDMNTVEAGGNQDGLTYGPDMYHTDLIGVSASEGFDGYCYAKDINGPDFASPEEALAWQEEIEKEYPNGYDIPVYEKDGKTQIGTFHIR